MFFLSNQSSIRRPPSDGIFHQSQQKLKREHTSAPPIFVIHDNQIHSSYHHLLIYRYLQAPNSPIARNRPKKSK